MANHRDNFSRPIIEALAKRAGYLCSNPDCRKLTAGANAVSNKATIIGEAAHISAAAERGPRYDSSLTPDQRADISNGIWLCASCATLIDKDPDNYPPALLFTWKGGVEAETRIKLQGGFRGHEPYLGTSTLKRPILEVDFSGGGRGRSNAGYSMKNPKEIYEGQVVLVPGPEPIIHWDLHWRFQMNIYNNSSYPAYNVKIENVNDFPFKELGLLDKVNNIPPLEKKELTVRYEDRVEGIWSEADAILKTKYPARFEEGLIMKISYDNEERMKFYTLVSFKSGQLINRFEPEL